LGLVQGALPWVLLAIWFVGALTTGAMAWRRWAAFRQLLVHASPAPADWQSLAAGLAETLSIRRSPEVLTVPGRLPPLVLPGLRRPRMLLPEDLIGQLNSSQRDALLTHELVHIRRGDHLVRILELVIGVAYWWFPVVRSVGKQLRVCEETCCDHAVVSQLPEARRDYACLLLDVVDFASPPPGRALPQATAMSAASDLEGRLRAILHQTPKARGAWPASVLSLVAACAILPCDLRYESRPKPVASNAALAPAAMGAAPLNESCEVNLSAVYCCPR
jgi:beta-lactamase regulating signal transducer with metallopeptidase domain